MDTPIEDCVGICDIQYDSTITDVIEELYPNPPVPNPPVYIPTVSGLLPNNGVYTGGTSVTISGTNFVGVIDVKFGDDLATDVVVLNNTEITCVSPSHGSYEAVDVVVRNSYGSSSKMRILRNFYTQTKGLFVWGDNIFGEACQNPDIYESFSSPVQVGSGVDWSDVAIGKNSVYAIRSGKLYSWGQNDSGQLCVGDRLNRSSPIQVGLKLIGVEFLGKGWRFLFYRYKR